MTTPIDLPTGPVPQWCNEMAGRLYKSHPDFWPTIAARLIWKYVPEPVSPELQAAREAQERWVDVAEFSVTDACVYAIERFKELEGRGNG